MNKQELTEIEIKKAAGLIESSIKTYGEERYDGYGGWVSYARKANATIASLKTSKDLAYSERDKLVALLSKLFPASLERHPEEDKDWENDWRWIVFINLPTGQVSWHIHDSEISMFNHLKRKLGVKWDGHTTEEKWKRVAAYPPPA